MNYLWYCWIIFVSFISGSAAGQWQGDDRDWRPLPDHPGAQLHQTLRPWDWQCPGQITIGQKCLILPQLWIKSWHSLGESVIPDSRRSRSIVHGRVIRFPSIQVVTSGYFGRKSTQVVQESNYGTNRVWTNNPTFLLSGQLTGNNRITGKRLF